MLRAFVTYSHQDSDFVDKLVADLETFGLALVLDKRLIRPGDSLLKIFEEIGRADFLLAILSPHSVNSNWVDKELAGAVIREIEEPDFKVIPVIKEQCQIPPALKQALRDKYQARFDSKSYDTVLKEIMQSLSPAIAAGDVYAEFQGPVSDNPFRRVRAEHFENISTLARSYSEPEAARYERIVETKPVLLEGGRGSGKTMTLKSMLPQALVSRHRRRALAETEAAYFGVYLRLVPGSFATQAQSVETVLGTDRCIDLFLTETILKLTTALVNELRSCAESGVVHATSSHERRLAAAIANVIRPSAPMDSSTGSLDDVEALLAQEVRFVTDYVKRRLFGEARDYAGVFLSVEDLKRICRAITTVYLTRPEMTVYFLLDEFENLLPFQKIVANSILKASEAGHYSVKIAIKKAALTTSETLEHQEIEEPHDYSSVDFDYNLSDAQERRHYKGLLAAICSRLLSHEGFVETDIGKLLESPLELDGVKRADLDKEVSMMSGRARPTAEDRHRFEYAAVYRLRHRERNRSKDFSGFDDLVILSSGVVRLFLELSGLSYHFAVQENVDVKGGQPIGRDHQTSAAYALSNYYLDTIKSNVATVGPQIQQLVIDLGDIFRSKLLKHNSEPEASRVSIHDPHRLEEPTLDYVKAVLTQGVVHSIFQSPASRGGMRPKHPPDIQPREYILNRVYSPSLGISPRPRWRTRLSTNDLVELLDPNRRQRAKSKLIRRVTTNGSSGLQPELPLEDESS